MLAKRIIPCLDVDRGRVVKGVNFVSLKDAGDPVELAKSYNRQGADELVFLDITASSQNRKTLLDIVRQVAQTIFIPFTVGGGIGTIEDVAKVLSAGADKISLNSAAVSNPELISETANKFGSQCVVIAIDAKNTPSGYKVFIKGGKEATGKNVLDWAKQAEKSGAGEILLTSMDRDGTKNGFDIELTKLVSQSVSIPVIASGGAGKKEDFYDIFSEGFADAALAASLFHYNETSISAIKEFLQQKQIVIRI